MPWGRVGGRGVGRLSLEFTETYVLSTSPGGGRDPK